MPTTKAGKRLAAELGVEYRIALINAAEAEARYREDIRLAEAVRRLDIIWPIDRLPAPGDAYLSRAAVLALLEEPDDAHD